MFPPTYHAGTILTTAVYVPLAQSSLTGWERTVHMYRCPALYSGRIFVSLCRELIIFVF